MSVASWVHRGVWDRARSVAGNQSANRFRGKEVALPTRKFRRAELMLPSRERVDPVAMERRSVVAEVIRVAQAELDDADWQILDRLIMGNEAGRDIAVEMGVTPQGVSHRRGRIVDKLRRIVAGHDHLMRHDEHGVVAAHRRRGV